MTDNPVVYDLPFSKFHLAAPLLQQAWFDEAYINMVLEGIQPGSVFVDNLEQPTAALLCHPYEFYVAGDASAGNPLRQFIKDNPVEPDIFHTLYGYCALSDAWEAALLEDAGGKLNVIPRRNFKFKQSALSQDWRAGLPPQVSIRRIASDLAIQVDNQFHGRISRNWGSRRAFLDHSFGFCLLTDGEIASLVDVVGISSGYSNFGVFTVESHRNQGYATLVCMAAVEYSLSQGKLPTWDCDGANAGSAALAQKIGFEEDRAFSQLSPNRGETLPLSTGLWKQIETDIDTDNNDVDEIIVWGRTA